MSFPGRLHASCRRLALLLGAALATFPFHGTALAQFGFAFIGFSENRTVVDERAGTVQVTLFRFGNEEIDARVRIQPAAVGTGVAVPMPLTAVVVDLPAGTNEVQVTLPVLDNELAGTNRNVNLNLSALSNQTRIWFQNPTLQVVVLDDDAVAFRFESPELAVLENDPAAALAVFRDGNSRIAASVDLVVTAPPGALLSRSATNRVQFAIGQTRVDVPFPGGTDFLSAGHETATAALRNPAPAIARLGTPSTAAVTIIDTDSTVEITDTRVRENAGTATLHLFRTGSTAGTASGILQPEAGTARPGTDYAEAAIPFSFAPGASEATVTVPILDDAVADGPRHFRMRFQSVAGSRIVRPFAVVRIDDDEPAPERALVVDTTASFGARLPGLEALAAGPNGTWYLAGSFGAYHGTAYPGIVRITSLGTPDPSWRPDAAPNGTLRHLASLPDFRVVVGGTFSQWGTEPRQRLAILAPDGSLDFNAPALDVADLVTFEIDPANRIVVGGAFVTLGNQQANGLGRILADGTLDTGFNPAGLPNTGFARLESLPAGGYAQLDPTGVLDWIDDFGTVLTNASIILPQDEAGALLPLADGSVLTGPARVHRTRHGSADEAVGGSLRGASRVWAPPGGNLFGLTHDGVDWVLRRHRADGSADPDVAVRFDGPVKLLAEAADGAVLVGGDFTHVDGVAAPGLALLVPRAARNGVAWNSGEAGFAVSERTGSARIPLRREDPAGPATVEVQVGASPALPPGTPPVATAQFADGSREGWVELPIQDQAAPGQDPVLELTLAEAVRIPGTPAVTRVRVFRDEPVFSFTAAEVVLEEPVGITPAGGVPPVGPGMRLVRTAGSAHAASARIRFEAGTTRPGYQLAGLPSDPSPDFAIPAPGFEVAFSPGASSAWIPGGPIDDALPQGDREAHLRLVDAPGAAFASLRIIRRDNDTAGPARALGAPVRRVAGPPGFLWDGPRLVDGQLEPGPTVLRDDGSPAPGALPPGLPAGTRLLGTIAGGVRIVSDDPDAPPGTILQVRRLRADGSVDAAYGPVQFSRGNGPVATAVGMDGSLFLLDGVPEQPGRLRIRRFGPAGVEDNGYKGLFRWSETMTAVPAPVTLHSSTDGRLLVAGSGVASAEGTRTSAIRLTADGATDGTFDCQLFVDDGSLPRVDGVAGTGDGTWLLWGRFDRVGGVPARNLARLGADGRLDAGFEARLQPADAATTLTLAAPLPGQRTAVITRAPAGTRLHLLDPAGLQQGAAIAIDGNVDAVLSLADGRMILTGQFRAVDGLTRWREAWLGADGRPLAGDSLALRLRSTAEGTLFLDIVSSRKATARIQSSDDLRQWSDLGAARPIEAGTTTIEAATTGTARFFRVLLD